MPTKIKPHFFGTLELAPRPDGGTWNTASRFGFQASSGESIEVPENFHTDLASIPRVAWIGGALIILGMLFEFVSFWGSATVGLGLGLVFLSPFLRHDGKYTRAAVVHDWVYRTHLFPRRACDGFLLEAMLVDRVALWQRVIIYFNVRLFGWLAYRNEKRWCEPEHSWPRYGGQHFMSHRD